MNISKISIRNTLHISLIAFLCILIFFVSFSRSDGFLTSTSSIKLQRVAPCRDNVKLPVNEVNCKKKYISLLRFRRYKTPIGTIYEHPIDTSKYWFSVDDEQGLEFNQFSLDSSNIFYCDNKTIQSTFTCTTKQVSISTEFSEITGNLSICPGGCTVNTFANVRVCGQGEVIFARARENYIFKVQIRNGVFTSVFTGENRVNLDDKIEFRFPDSSLSGPYNLQRVNDRVYNFISTQRCG